MCRCGKRAGRWRFCLGITAAAVIARRRFPYLLVGWLWFLGMSVPVIGFVQLGVVAVADRNTYLPQIGLAIAIAWGAADACRARPRHQPRWAVAAALVLAILLVCRLAADVVLARQRDALEPRLGLHVEQPGRARQLGSLFAARRASGRGGSSVPQGAGHRPQEPASPDQPWQRLSRIWDNSTRRRSSSGRPSAVDPKRPGTSQQSGTALDEAGAV